MGKRYVIRTSGGYRVAGSRVSLDSVVYDYLSGLSPESIVEDYDTLTLEQVFGALAYYLAHEAEINKHLRRNREKFEKLRLKARAAHAWLSKKVEDTQEVAS
jgi:uncharacterized protein (DUF433 family)